MRISKLDMLKDWCIRRKIFNTTDAKIYGVENFYTSADVRVRNLVTKGFLRAIPHEESLSRGLLKKGYKNLRWYEIA